MEDVKKAFAKRLREAMERLNYPATPAVLEREFNQRFWGKGVTLHGVRRWLHGEALPTQDKLVVLAQWLHMTPQQLRYGDDPPVMVTDEAQYSPSQLIYEERETRDAFLKLSPPEQRRLRAAIRAFILTYAKESESKGSADDAES